MLRIRRLWLLPALFVILLFYYLFQTTGKQPSIKYDPNLRLAKHPERYPVSTFADLPLAPAKSLPRIQHDFARTPESSDARKIRVERQNVVKESFLHAWTGYKTYAWRKDEVAPLSGISHDSYGGWGATLVDSMDTLWILNLHNDFEQCVRAVERIDFTKNTEQTLNVFETTIRYLGGLLAAYDISDHKYPSLLKKATELADILYMAFDTPNRMPATRWDWRRTAAGGEISPGSKTLLAELGSLELEFTRLSQLTGNNKYFDAVQRITEELIKAQDKTKVPGLWPTLVDAHDLEFVVNHFTFGGMADSTYEYLPKQYMLMGGHADEYKHMYEKAIEPAKDYILYRPLLPNNEDILLSGNAGLTDRKEIGTDPQAQHLTCFVSGMMAIASKLFHRTDELAVAKRLLDGCVWAYNAMPTGLMPETFHTLPCKVGVGPANKGKCEWSDDRWYEGVARQQGNNSATVDLSVVEAGKYWVRQKSLPPGFTDIGDGRYILRPEAIESIFIMYRITGDAELQNVAWKMFQSIESQTRTAIAHAGIHDVRAEYPTKNDRMESFWLAETLKYFYLIFAEPDVVSLDDWVLNTEAHPFRRPKAGQYLTE